MLIGEDYPKIKMELGSYLVYEPNVFVTDLMMSFVCFLFAFYIFKSVDYKKEFSKWWYYFFLLFGFSSLAGGLGHAFFYYWGPEGKSICWISSLIAIYFIERAMISCLTEMKWKSTFVFISKIKLSCLIIYLGWMLVSFSSEQLNINGFIPVAYNTIASLILSAGLLGGYLSKKMNANFKWFFFGVFMMLPAAIIFLMKISFFRWFDKNDLSHLFITFGFILFYKGIKLIDLETKTSKSVI